MFRFQVTWYYHFEGRFLFERILITVRTNHHSNKFPNLFEAPTSRMYIIDSNYQSVNSSPDHGVPLYCTLFLESQTLESYRSSCMISAFGRLLILRRLSMTSFIKRIRLSRLKTNRTQQELKKIHGVDNQPSKNAIYKGRFLATRLVAARQDNNTCDEQLYARTTVASTFVIP